MSLYGSDLVVEMYGYALYGLKVVCSTIVRAVAVVVILAAVVARDAAEG